MTRRLATRLIKSWRGLPVAGALLLLAGLAGCAAAPATPAPGYRAVNLQPGDGVTINGATGDVVIDITSERGIGKIEFERLGPAPKSVTFNLHLKGLEEFQLAWAGVVVTGHYPSQGNTAREEVSRAGGVATAQQPGGPYYATVTIEGADPTIPLTGGYFAVTAPPAFIQDAPTRFTLQWIDFYR